MKTAEQLFEIADDLFLATCAVMRNQRNKDSWHNLENAAIRWNAARQAENNGRISCSRLVSPVTDNPQEDAFYERAEASVAADMIIK